MLSRLALLLLSATLAAAPAARAANPTLYFTYSTDCTFTVSVDGGGSTASLPPGIYQVWVGTPEPFADDPVAGCPYPRFQLTGPGVSISTDLSSGGETVAQFTATLAAGATYIAQDTQIAASRRTIGIATSGSASSLAPGSSSTATSGGSTTPDTNQSQSVVGSAAGQAALRGSLVGAVSSAGVPALTKRGKAVAVTILKSGRYMFVIRDRSPKTGFVLQPPHGHALTVTGATFVGTKRVALKLTRGQWSFGARHAFLVTS